MLRDRHVLARDKARFVGDPVAAIAATDDATASEALGLIDVRYELLPAVFTPEEALAEGAPIIHDELASYTGGMGPNNRRGNQSGPVTIERGDIEAAFAQADVVVEGTFNVQPVLHGYIEPRSCLAAPDENGRINVWAANKSPFGAREAISEGLGIPLSKVRLQTPTIGGSFGGKPTPSIEPICALLASKAGAPVKLELDMHEEMSSHYTRQFGQIKMKLAASKDGKILGIEGELLFNAGAYGGGSAGSISNLQGAYNIPAIRLSGLSAVTNCVPTGAVRAPGAPQSIFVIESMMDELAHKTGLDPLEVRRKNALNEGDPAPGGRGVMGKSGLAETIEKVSVYVKEHMAECKPNQGVGVACGMWGAGFLGASPPTKSIVKLNEDGSATLLTGMTENGAGQHVVLAQVVAEILGLTTDEVAIVAADTDVTPFDSGPGGSRGTVRVALAVQFAAEDVRRQLFDVAAARLEANPVDLEIRNRQVYVKGSPDRAISLAALATAANNTPGGAIVGTGESERRNWVEESKSWPKTVADDAAFCTHAAKVEVDVETGEVKVLQYVAAQDVGKALNAITCAGQLHGAVIHGIGYALHEELLTDGGRPINADLANYRLPTADIMPTVDTIMIEEPSPHGPFGARGVGESSITPVAAAIANAVYDAVGVRVTSLPLSPEKVLRALREKTEAGA
jgi:CO/xanthine dehydrogenase Mo-binding subunit